MRNNGAKYVIVFALLISVVALSLGFAAYSSTLTIKATADVSGNQNNFNISLSKSNSAVTTGAVTPTVTGATGASATLSANKIEGLKATFTDRGQSVKYSFYAYNAGQFLGYLNSVAIGSKTCTPVDGTNATYVANACNGISISVKVGSGTGLTFTSTNNSISSHSLAVGTAEPIEVTISYGSTAALADGDFSVAFGDIVLTYGSAD